MEWSHTNGQTNGQRDELTAEQTDSGKTGQTNKETKGQYSSHSDNCEFIDYKIIELLK